MNQKFLITHYYHSGFSVANGDTLLVFDYWRGEEGELTGALELTEEKLKRFAHVVVFISHEHVDHMDPIVFTWRDWTDVTYIVAYDMPVGTRGRRVSPGDRLYLREDLSLSVFDSTDLGVSFLVAFRGCRFFHAGDLNFWHWREESTMQEIEEADAEFRQALRPLSREEVDVAFFPLDPRQGAMFEAGCNAFILSVRPRLLIPMHYFHRADVAVEYSRTAGNRATEVLAMPELAETIVLELDEEGYLNISAESEEEEETPEVPEPPENEETLSRDSPFFESDLPLAQLATSDEEEKASAKPESSESGESNP